MQQGFGDRSFFYKFKTFEISSIFLNLVEKTPKDEGEDGMFIKLITISFLGTENIIRNANAIDEDTKSFIERKKRKN